MTVKELKEKLEQYPEDTLVAISCWEDQAFAESLKLCNRESAPSVRGDDIWFCSEGELKDEEKILFIIDEIYDTK